MPNPPTLDRAAIVLSRAGHTATVKVGDVVPLRNGDRGVVREIVTAGTELLVCLERGGWLVRYGADGLDKLAPKAGAIDIAAIEEAAYKRGWQDREDDLTLGVARLGAPAERAKAPKAVEARILPPPHMSAAMVRWAITRPDGTYYCDEESTPYLYRLKRTAADVAKRHGSHARVVRVLITPAPRRRKP